MIGMARASLRTERYDGFRLERIDDRRQAGAQLAERFEGREVAVGQSQLMELAHAESVGSALSFLGAGGGELRAGGNVREIANAFGAVGGDDQMGLASFPGELG